MALKLKICISSLRASLACTVLDHLCTLIRYKMMRAAIFFGIFVIFCLIHLNEANYKKLPFNGSIFGKRNNADYDSTGRALSALCDIASETCQAYYQSLENM